MNCKVDFKKLSKYSDGAVSLLEKNKIDTHIQTCSKCKERIENIYLLKTSLSNLPEIKESHDFDFRFKQKLHERLEQKPISTINQTLEKAFDDIREAFMPRVPALVRLTAVFIFFT